MQMQAFRKYYANYILIVATFPMTLDDINYDTAQLSLSLSNICRLNNLSCIRVAIWILLREK
jgi:hypothetical protein